jgi:hypothetical protein
MPKNLLTKNDLLELDSKLIEIYGFFGELRSKSAIARLIHLPSVPAEFSESLTIHCSERFFGAGWKAKFGGRLCDVILEKTGERRTVEVKATGQTSFQELKAKDLAADFIVWIHFGERYINGSGKLQVYILRSPNQYIHNPLRLKLHEFLRLEQESIMHQDWIHIESDSLVDLLEA